MRQAPRFSLWLRLPREAHERFQSLIAKLSARLGTPLFEPHITLLGGLSGSEEALRRQTRALAGATAPFEVRLLEVGCLDEYYRCLFVKIALSRALQEVHAVARRFFDQSLDADFTPHLSLVYGNLEEKEKENILDDIGRDFYENLRLEELGLYDTSGPVWRCVERGRFGAAGGQVSVRTP
ncbi:MAG: 2'-5' RNA ligase family protein [Gammaproteobacteria bacterium]|nr:2'-5' RNA ligase family protein [Gammaproteobacteria bacterium]MDH3407213.1 2'-5' RNA ligase family protein [Gammaproteobacteria bacterium]MDH3562423.1 2'-5' RNA ligase family protein [Gammaproteobacteria bacterium]MDH5487072.1 2'-5' RNA ligase family protein [Gammaproteobacteria bacterium]